MENNFVPYELVLELKELGFNEYCLTSYLNGELQTSQSEMFWFQHNYRSHPAQEFISAPLYQQAFRWFREKYGYYISVFRTHDSNWGTDLWLLGVHKPKATVFSETYEEAELACLEKLIEIVKTNNYE